MVLLRKFGYSKDGRSWGRKLVISIIEVHIIWSGRSIMVGVATVKRIGRSTRSRTVQVAMIQRTGRMRGTSRDIRIQW